jgi:hypothetical protein
MYARLSSADRSIRASDTPAENTYAILIWRYARQTMVPTSRLSNQLVGSPNAVVTFEIVSSQPSTAMQSIPIASMG